jgi:hypothetical protein
MTDTVIAAMTSILDIPIMRKTGSATALWTAQPMAGATSRPSGRGATRAAIGRPMQVQRTIASPAQINAFVLEAISNRPWEIHGPATFIDCGDLSLRSVALSLNRQKIFR